MSSFIFLLPAFLACLILTGIHAYLGLHVVRRGVIFLDIALAQIAALGITVGMYFGFEGESQTSYFFALAATMGAAILFSVIRKHKFFLEAIIGITFAVSSSLSIIFSDQLPHGGEHLKHLLNGNILWVSYSQLIKTALIYFVIGIVHYFLRHQLTRLSEKHTEKHSFWLDLFFYGSFGLVITSSVQIAGVLLVFSFLIVPAVIAQLFFETWKQQTIFGWIFGAMASFLGVLLSYLCDWPTGSTLVSVFGLLALGAFGLKKLMPTSSI